MFLITRHKVYNPLSELEATPPHPISRAEIIHGHGASNSFFGGKFHPIILLILPYSFPTFPSYPSPPHPPTPALSWIVGAIFEYHIAVYIAVDGFLRLKPVMGIHPLLSVVSRLSSSSKVDRVLARNATCTSDKLKLDELNSEHCHTVQGQRVQYFTPVHMH